MAVKTSEAAQSHPVVSSDPSEKSGAQKSSVLKSAAVALGVIAGALAFASVLSGPLAPVFLAGSALLSGGAAAIKHMSDVVTTVSASAEKFNNIHEAVKTLTEAKEPKAEPASSAKAEPASAAAVAPSATTQVVPVGAPVPVVSMTFGTLTNKQPSPAVGSAPSA